MAQETLERRVRVIPATRPANRPSGPRRSGKQRVAAYCRVSTDSEEQFTSYTAQKAYYTQKIGENPDWEMAGIFADGPVKIGLNQKHPTARGALV